jgi:hypothetical protein
LSISHARSFIIAAREVALWQASVPIWRTNLPTPVEFQPDTKRHIALRYDSDWMLLSCSDPTTDGEQIYVHTHWAKCLGSNGYFYEQEWDDRASVEILSMRDGGWLRREEIPMETPSPARDECRMSQDGFKLYSNQVFLGLLAIAPEQRLIDGDLSMADRRLIVAIADDRFAFFELVD